MYSGDVDGLISGFDGVIEACVSQIQSLTESTNYQLETPGSLEKEVPATVDLGSIQGAASSMAGPVGNAKSLGDSVYTGANGYNTSSGSPWTEIDRFNTVLNAVAGSASDLKFVTEKASALACLSMLLSLAVDAKQAVIAFHDSLTRGFDSQYNGGKSSISWNNSVKGGKTSGSWGDTPAEPIDPY